MTLAFGFFDGVHLGHQAILRGADRVLTFTRHPLALLDAARAPHLIMTLEERLAAIRACGVREIMALDFDATLAATSAEDFFARHLEGCSIRCGANARFGCGARGDVAFLKARLADVTVVPYAMWEGEPISSSRIRRTLATGNVRSARAMLGHPVSISGTVAAGKGLGRTLGFPTVNVVPSSAPGIPYGVYVAEACGRRAVANYGLAPSLGDRAWRQPVLEIHFPGSVPEAGGSVPECSPSQHVSVNLLDFIRPERTFPSRADLVRQIRRDVEAASAADRPILQLSSSATSAYVV